MDHYLLVLLTFNLFEVYLMNIFWNTKFWYWFWEWCLLWSVQYFTVQTSGTILIKFGMWAIFSISLCLKNVVYLDSSKLVLIWTKIKFQFDLNSLKYRFWRFHSKNIGHCHLLWVVGTNRKIFHGALEKT